MNRSAKLVATSEAGLATQIVLQILCGLLLAFWYTATPADSHASAEAIRSAPFPRMFVGIHFWGGQILMAHSLFHIAAMVWTGSYRDAWVVRWYLAIGVCICSFAMLMTGNLLPFDRHGVQSAVTEIAIADRVPIFGSMVAETMAGGKKFGGTTLSTWYGAHRWLIPLFMVALFAASYALRAFQDAAKKSTVGMCLPSILAVALGVVFRAPLGPAATSADYGSFNAPVNWYAWPLHGALKAFDAISPQVGWVGFAVVPLVVVAFLAALPRLCEKVTPMCVKALFAAVVGGLIVLAALFGGAPASPFNRNDVAAEVYAAPSGAPGDIDPGLAAGGKDLFQQVGCVGCHGADGKGTLSGPALTFEGRKHPDAAWYREWIHNPRSVKPSSTMPAFPRLSEDELRQLGEYLRAKR